MSRDVFETRLFGTLKWLSIVFFLVITLFPLVYMVSLSFKDIPEVVTDPGDVLPSWEQITSSETYQDVLRSRDEGGFGFVRFMTNSAIVSFLTVGVTVFFAIFGAYAAARLQFRGKKAVQSGILAIYLFPAVVTAIPLFVLFTRIRFGDLPLRSNLWSLAIVYLAQTIPVALYMLRSHFNSVPFSLEEAGMVDGLTRAQVIWKITFPLSAPAVAAVSLYVFMIAWNEFLFAFLFMVTNQENWTLALGLQQLNTTEVPATALMAGSVLISLPVIILFFAAERFLTEGLTAGGVKG